MTLKVQQQCKETGCEMWQKVCFAGNSQPPVHLLEKWGWQVSIASRHLMGLGRLSAGLKHDTLSGWEQLPEPFEVILRTDLSTFRQSWGAVRRWWGGQILLGACPDLSGGPCQAKPRQVQQRPLSQAPPSCGLNWISPSASRGSQTELVS